MSVRCITDVLDKSNARGNARLLMIVLADFANDDGECFPAVATLARKTKLAERTIQALLRSLVASGELSIIPGAGLRGTNLYVIHRDQLGVVGGAESAGVQNLRGADLGTEGVQILHPSKAKPLLKSAPEPSIKPSIKPSSSKTTQKPAESATPHPRDDGDDSTSFYQETYDWLAGKVLNPERRRECSRYPLAAVQTRWQQVATGKNPQHWAGRLVKSLADAPPTDTPLDLAPPARPAYPPLSAEWATMTDDDRNTSMRRYHTAYSEYVTRVNGGGQ